MSANTAIQSQLAQIPTDELIRLYREAVTGVSRLVEYAYRSVQFKPNAVQKRALAMLDDGIRQGIRSFGILPGKGCGKTSLLVNLIWNIAEGPQNEEFEKYQFVRRWPFRKELRIVCDAADMKEDSGGIWQMIQQWWPSGRWQGLKHGMDYYSVFKLPNGFTVSVRTFDQPRRLHESNTLGAVFFNEAPYEAGLWQQYGGRLREGGFRSIWATVWEEEAYWIKDEIIENPRARYMFGDIHDCCKDCYPDGHLSHKNIEATILDYPEELREACRTGVFTGLRHQVFRIVPEVHFVDTEDLPQPHQMTRYGSLDPHPIRPWVYIVGGITELGDWYILDEWPKEPYHKIRHDNRGIADYAAIIKEMDARHSVFRRVIDRKASVTQIRRDYGCTTLLNDLREKYQLEFELGNTHVEGEDGGVMKLKSLLRFDRSRPLDYLNRPHLYVLRSCWNTCYQLQNLCRKRDIRGELTEELDERFLDFPRAVMYLVMAGFRYRPAAGQTPLDMDARTREVMRRLRDRRAGAVPIGREPRIWPVDLFTGN